MAVPTDKRKRKREGRQARQEQILAAQRRARRRRGVVAGLGVLVVISMVAALFGTGESGDDQVAADRTTTTAPSTSTTAAAAVGTAPCPAPDGSSPTRKTFDGPPAFCIDPAKSYRADVATDVGTFTIELDAERAPRTVNSFVFLSRYHAFDGVPFHRVVPGFVVQGGDVERGDGQGGPGYNLPDELPQAGDYEIGSVAMANTRQPGSGGSQFFVITGDQGVSLPPTYSLFGKVTAGLDVIKKIEADGSPDPNPPRVVHRITGITILEA